MGLNGVLLWCRQLPEYCMEVGRALVTPTRIVSLPTETELSNRILRRFKKHSDHFIRLSFGDEDAGILYLGPKADSSPDLTARQAPCFLLRAAAEPFKSM
jgi:hypothetical protein